MRTFILCLAVAAPALAAPPVAFGPGTLAIDAQLRPRLVVDSGRDFVDDELIQREYVTQRARLGATLKHDDGVTLRVLLQDHRIWGEEAGTLDGSAAGFDAHEAWLELPLYRGASLRAGRQEIVLDDARLFGNVGWTQRARSFDALRGMWRGDALDIDLFFVVDSENDTDGDGSPSGRGQIWVGGAHGTYKAEGVKLSVAAYSKKNHPADELRHTVGVFGRGGDALWGEGQVWYQLGDLGEESINTFMIAARTGYTTEGAWAPSVILWGEYLKGDGTPEGAFDTLYATNHKFYGEMDLFLNIPAHTANLGLIDAGGRLQVKPKPGTTVQVDGHYFLTVEPDAADETALGTEIDASVKWAAQKHVSFRALYGIFLPGKVMETLRGDATEHMFFLTTDVKY